MGLLEERLGAEVPVFHHPCGKREVRIGLWGRELRHPDNCPLCRQAAGNATQSLRARHALALSKGLDT